MTSTDPLRSYRETQIKTAAQGKLILMLYDGALKFLSLAREGLEAQHRKYDEVSTHLIRCQDIISELMVSLDFDRGGEIARNLFSLYMYCNRRILDANIKKDTAPLEEVKRILSGLRDAWASIADKAPSEGLSAEGGGVNIAG
ncbi:MAG: flagellar export chaperone FliS [Spirochaetales bacterium]|nr:flagellar export chaperone FliS [Spirochaetales bacterium]